MSERGRTLSAATELLVDGFTRIGEVVHEAVDGLSPDQLAYRPDSDANSITWLVWHLTRIQDDHIADAAGLEQVWTAQGFAERFALPFDTAEHGYGHSSAEVGEVRGVEAGLLTGYHDAVRAQTIGYVTALADSDFDRIVDRRWNPPVTLAIRLISVISDDLQHAGQAAYVRGLIERGGVHTGSGPST
jgi:hypothetical protein